MKPYFEATGVVLYHGDCLTVLPTLEAGSVDAVVMDPPYGIGYRFGENREVANDPQTYGAFLLPVVQQCKRASKAGAFFAVWQAQLNYRHFWTWFGDDIHIYAAAKNFVALRSTPMNYGYDPVVCWYQKGKPLRPEKQARSVDFHVANVAGRMGKKFAIGHPTPRPLDTVASVVDNFTLPGGLCLDPFAGSGTTGVACVQTGRRFIGVELSEQYCEIAAKRIEAAIREAVPA